jgi:hypothetical protein
VREGKDEPGIFGDHVGGYEVDFREFVGDGASVDAAVGVDAVEAVEELACGFDLDADQARAGSVVEVGGVGRVLKKTGAVTVEDYVVAFAVAVGVGDSEAEAGGFEGEG